MDLFSYQNETESAGEFQPLAAQLRPKTWEEFKINSAQARKQIEGLFQILDSSGRLPSVIFWGPPGVGKTTIAKILMEKSNAHVESVNAVSVGAKKIREMGELAYRRRVEYGQSTLLFIDEIHRLNKAQQDVLLPFTEKGDFTLIGATTENPGYEVNSALLSRCRVIVLDRHADEVMREMAEKACAHGNLTIEFLLTKNSLNAVIEQCDGDARKLIGVLEYLIEQYNIDSGDFPIAEKGLSNYLGHAFPLYDQEGDEHYNCISAFIKSVRGSDPDAAVYYLARMLKGGEDPKFIARRLVILASEDIGNADPKALPLAVSAFQSVELLGLPECRIPLSQVTIYLAGAPKSNSAYRAIGEAYGEVGKTGSLPIPKSLRSSRNSFSKGIGYGEGYKYSHDGPKGYQKQDFLPEKIKNKSFYEPNERGFEKNIKKYVEWMRGES